jgi:hypothetical protein
VITLALRRTQLLLRNTLLFARSRYILKELPMNKHSLVRLPCMAACLIAAGGAFAQAPPAFSFTTAVGPLAGGKDSFATGVNLNANDTAAGATVVGGSTVVTTGGKNAIHAFAYSGSFPPADLGTLVGPNGLLSSVNGININGQSVGYSYTTTGAVSPIASPPIPAF